MTAGAVALVCILALAVGLLEVTGGGNSNRSRPRAAARSGQQGQYKPEHQPTNPEQQREPQHWPHPEQPTSRMPNAGELGREQGVERDCHHQGTISRYTSPGGPPDGTIPATWYGGVSALPVIADKAGWLEVRLATRPNGSTGWVQQGNVTVTATPEGSPMI